MIVVSSALATRTPWLGLGLGGRTMIGARQAGFRTDRAELIYRLSKQERVTLTREMGLQVLKLITRQVRRQLVPFKPSLHLERRLKELERRATLSEDELRRDLVHLRDLFAATLANKAVPETGMTVVAPRLSRLLRGSQGPARLKRRLSKVMKKQGVTGAPLVLVTPGRSDGGPEQALPKASKQGMALLVHMLEAIPQTPSRLRSQLKRLRRGELPLSILPPATLARPAAKSKAEPRSDPPELTLRQPLKGVLRMRIEPPEAARALAQHMNFGDIPLVYKQPQVPPPSHAVAETRSVSAKAEVPLRSRNQANVKAGRAAATKSSWSTVEVEGLAQVVKATLQKDFHLPPTQVRLLADQVYQVIEDRLLVERNRRGLR